MSRNPSLDVLALDATFHLTVNGVAGIIELNR